MVRFHESLSDRSVYLRYFHHMAFSTRVTHERLARICFIDYDREMVLVAESAQAKSWRRTLTRERSSADAEFALLVSDAWHERGLGTELLRKLSRWPGKRASVACSAIFWPRTVRCRTSAANSASRCDTRSEEGVVKASITDSSPQINDDYPSLPLMLGRFSRPVGHIGMILYP